MLVKLLRDESIIYGDCQSLSFMWAMQTQDMQLFMMTKEYLLEIEDRSIDQDGCKKFNKIKAGWLKSIKHS